MKTNRTARRRFLEHAVVGTVLLIGSLGVTGRADILFVSNESNNTIERFSAAGSDLGKFAANPHSGAAPFGLAFDNAANLYVAYPNTFTNMVKFSVDGSYLFSFGFGLGYSQGIAFDGAGNLYVADTENNKIEKFSTSGVDLGAFTTSGLNNPRGIAFDSAGNLYAANSGNISIEKFSPAGVDLGVFAKSPGALLAYPFGLAFDSAGNLYVADLTGDDIEKLSPTGADLGAFASIGQGAPEGLAFDSAGNLYVACQGGSKIEKFTPSGVGSVFASNGVSGPTFLAFTDDSGHPLPLPPPGAMTPTVRIDFVPPFIAGQFRVRVTGAPGTNYTVQVATNLDSSTNSWISLFTSNSATGTFDYLDPRATNSTRYYRAVSQ